MFDIKEGEILATEEVMYYIGIATNPDEASKAETFRKNATLLLKAIRIKFNYLEIESGEFFSFLCDATEEEVKQKITEYLGVYL